MACWKLAYLAGSPEEKGRPASEETGQASLLLEDTLDAVPNRVDCASMHLGSWHDNRVESPCQATLFTPANWRTRWPSARALFTVPGVSALSVSLDLTHNLFLGWLQHVYGSVLWLPRMFTAVATFVKD